MDKVKKSILSVLELLHDIDGIQVEACKPQQGTVHITFNTVRSLDFKFVWSTDHFIGYALDDEGESTQALVSIWTPWEAVQFTTAYHTFVMLRAGKK